MEHSEFDMLKLENQVCFPVYVLSKEIIRKYRPYLDEIGLTYTQYIAMMVMWEEKKVNVKELGKRLYLDSGTLTPLLKSLESKGFVKRARSEKDERVLIVSITDKGMRLREKALKIPPKIAACLKMDSDEAVSFYKMLYKLIGGLAD